MEELRIAKLDDLDEVSLDEVGDDVNLDTFGSGSGLLDLSLQADDTSLGGILDEIYTANGDEQQKPDATVEEVSAEIDQMTPVAVKVFLKEMVPSQPEELGGGPSTITEKKRERINTMFAGGEANTIKGMKYSGWAMYNAVTEWVDHDWMARKGLGVVYMLKSAATDDPTYKAMAMEQWAESLKIEPHQPKLVTLIKKYSQQD